MKTSTPGLRLGETRFDIGKGLDQNQTSETQRLTLISKR